LSPFLYQKSRQQNLRGEPGVSSMKKLILIILSLSAFACDSGVKWEDDLFAVYWIDDPKNIELGRKIGAGSYLGMTSPPFKAGSNNKYLVLKTEYGYNYYDKTVRDINNQSMLKRVGPLLEEDFLVAKSKLELPDFEIEYK